MKINPVLAAALSSLILLSGCDEEEPEEVQIVPAVVVEPAIEMEFADTVTEIGEVQAFETVHLSANVSGFLTEANFTEGDLVLQSFLSLLLPLFLLFHLLRGRYVTVPNLQYDKQ